MNGTSLYAALAQNGIVLDPGQLVAASAASLAVSLLLLFLGYKLVRVFMGLTGFCFGALLGAYLGMLWGGGALVLVLGLVLGLIVGAMGVGLYKLGAFVMCFTLGWGLGGGWGFTGGGVWWALLVGLAFGIGSVVLFKHAIIIASALGGAWGAVSAVYGLLGYSRQGGVVIIAWAVLAGLGIWAQYAMAVKKAPQAGQPPRVKKG